MKSKRKDNSRSKNAEAQENNQLLASSVVHTSNCSEESCTEASHKCGSKISLREVKSQEEFTKYIGELVSQVWKEINSDKFSIEPARIGFDMKDDSQCEIFDYDLMFQILTASGYCPECADNFIEAMSQCKDDEGNPLMMFIRRKEIGQVMSMSSKHQETL